MGAGVAPEDVGASLGVGAIVKEISRDPAVGAMVAPGTAVLAATGDGVKVPGTITQGAAPQEMLAAAMLARQQSSAPLVPGTAPQPAPPH